MSAPFFQLPDLILLYREDQVQLNICSSRVESFKHTDLIDIYDHLNQHRIDQFNGYTLYLHEKLQLEKFAKQLCNMLQSGDTRPAIRFNLAYFLYYLRQFKDSRRHLENIVSQGNEILSLVLTWLGNVCCGQKLFAEAVTKFNKGLVYSPTNPYILYRRAIALRKLSQFEESVKDLSFVVQNYPSYAYAHYELGNCFFDQGKRETALNHYQVATLIDHDFVAARYQWGVVLVLLGHLDQGQEVFEQIITQFQFPFAYIGIGNLHLIKGELNLAKERFLQALVLDPANATAHHNLKILQENS